jgi:FecR protein
LLEKAVKINYQIQELSIFSMKKVVLKNMHAASRRVPMSSHLNTFNLQKQIFKRLLIFLCGISLALGLQNLPIAAQSQVSQAEITQILDGSNVFIQNTLAKVKDSASKGQRVRTANARAQLTFNTGAVGRLAPNSVLTVGQCARLQKGTLLINGAMNGCTASVVAGVRGTTYVMEVNENGQSSIKVLEGEVRVAKSTQPPEEEVSDQPAPGQLPAVDKPAVDKPAVDKSAVDKPAVGKPAVGKPAVSKPAVNKPAVNKPAVGTKQLEEGSADAIVLQEGEQVAVSDQGVLGAIEQLSQEEFSRLLKGSLFNGFSVQLPGISKIQSSFQRLFPGVPFPVSIPGLRNIPTPRIPIRNPFF